MILCTGGSGFIGRRVVSRLRARGETVRVLDSFVAQAHRDADYAGPSGVERVAREREEYGSVTNPAHVAKALEGVDAVIHLAAEVGVGQSQYEIARYVYGNSYGTAVLLEAITKHAPKLRRLVVASSMSVYGEGYRVSRGLSYPTPESHPLRPASVYAITKRDQEELCLAVGAAYGIPTLALRFFNTYGAGQSLANPYTGAVAIFATALLAGHAPCVFEDGRQSRDFVNVEDVAAAVVAALDAPPDVTGPLNVGTGVATTILELATMLHARLGGQAPKVLGLKRAGDIRHCVADISAITRALGWTPTIALADGLDGMVPWLKSQPRVDDRSAEATEELLERGLVA